MLLLSKDMIVYGHNSCRRTNVSGHRSVWTQVMYVHNRVGTIMSVYKFVWGQACLSTVMYGHNHVWAQTSLGAVMWSQSCGHNHEWPQTWWNRPDIIRI